MTTLAELRVGQSGCVESITGSDDISIRLMEMGLTPGVAVSVIGTSLLGDPIELDVRGYRLSVRRSEAALVQLRPAQ